MWGLLNGIWHIYHQGPLSQTWISFNSMRIHADCLPTFMTPAKHIKKTIWSQCRLIQWPQGCTVCIPSDRYQPIWPSGLERNPQIRWIHRELICKHNSTKRSWTVYVVSDNTENLWLDWFWLWIRNHMRSKVWDEITYPYPNGEI